MHDYTKIKYLYAYEKENLFNVIKNDKSAHAIRNKAIFFLAEYAGLRASEITLMLESDFIAYNKEIYCKRLKRSNNNTLRIIDDNVYNALINYIEYKKEHSIRSDYFFISQKGNPISRKTLDVIMKNYCREAGIPDDKAHFHVLKHTRAITLADMGLDVREIQFWLGHKSVKNTEIYLQFTSRQQDILYSKLQN